MSVSTSNGSRAARDPWFLSGLWDKGCPTLQLPKCLGGQQDWFSRHPLATAPLYQPSVAPRQNKLIHPAIPSHQSHSKRQPSFTLATCLGSFSRTSRSEAGNRRASNQWSRIAAVSSSSNVKQRHILSTANPPRPAAASACSSREHRHTSRHVKRRLSLATTNHAPERPTPMPS